MVKPGRGNNLAKYRESLTPEVKARQRESHLAHLKDISRRSLANLERNQARSVENIVSDEANTQITKLERENRKYQKMLVDTPNLSVQQKAVIYDFIEANNKLIQSWSR